MTLIDVSLPGTVSGLASCPSGIARFRRLPPPDCPIHCRPRDLEQLAEVADRVFAGGVHLEQFALLEVGQLGRLAAHLVLVADDLHARAGAQADKVALEFSEGGEDVEEHLARRVVRVIALLARHQAHTAILQFIGDRPSTQRQRTTVPVRSIAAPRSRPSVSLQNATSRP